jgi:hypothetical protein
MSFFQTETVACPECGANVEFDVVYSVNAVLRPDLRDAILDRTFQRETCGQCGHSFRVDPELTYLDYLRRQWLLVRPPQDLAEWLSMEKYAHSFFEAAFGADAPASSRKLGKGLTVRLVFGWPAMREKLVCAELGLNDVDVELVKFGLLRNLDASLFSEQTELRLVGMADDQLGIAVINIEDELPRETIPVPKAIYDEIANDQGDWQALREQLAAGPFVDIRRLLAPAEITPV